MDEKKMAITGFAFRLNEDAADKNFELILYDMDSGKGYYPKMTYMLRDDVENYFKCEYNYQKSGFMANISLRKLNRNKDYSQAYPAKLFSKNVRHSLPNSDRSQPPPSA